MKLEHKIKLHVSILLIIGLFSFQTYAQKARIVLTGDLPFADGTKIRLIERGPNRYQDTTNFEQGEFQFVLEADTMINGEFMLMWTVTANEVEGSWLIRNRDGHVVPTPSKSVGFSQVLYFNSEESQTYHIQMKYPLPKEEFNKTKRTDIFYSWQYYPEVISESLESQVYSELQRLNGWNTSQRIKIADSIYQASSATDKIPNDFTSQSYALNDSINGERLATMAREILRKNPDVSTASSTIFNTRADILRAHGQEYEKLLHEMGPQVKETQMFQQAKAKLRSVLYLDVGAISPLPFGTDPDGNQLDFGIAEYKYTLLEFWASWCVPCREMNPTWNKLLANNEEKTLFQIIGVSIDEQTEHWKQAIKQDKLRNWKHISDLKGGFRGENGTRYALESIPFNILLDKEGRIVSKNIKPEILEKLLNDM